MFVRTSNRELKKLFKSAMLEYFESKYGIKLARLEECVGYLEKLDCTNSVVSQEILVSICTILEEMSNESVYINHINEAILREFLFSMLYAAGFSPLSIIRVHQIRCNYKRFDLCAAIRNDQAVVVECKVDETEETAGIAQILINGILSRSLKFSEFHEK